MYKRQLVVHPVEEELALDAVAWAAHAGALRAAALDHKTGNNAVEDQSVIEPLIRKEDEIIHGLRGNVRVELCGDDTAVFHFDGNNRIFHISDSFLSWRGRSDGARL